MFQENKMVKALEAARKAARKALESTYHEGQCSIVEYGDTTDPITHITRQGENVVAEGVPCKLSFEKLSATNQTETAAAITQGVKLFLAPEIVVKGGSKIIVEWQGRTYEYSCSGDPAVYATHQEIPLERFRGWA